MKMTQIVARLNNGSHQVIVKFVVLIHFLKILVNDRSWSIPPILSPKFFGLRPWPVRR